MKYKIQELYTLEQLSSGNTFVHKLHPTVKLVAAFLFIVTVVSFDRYAFGQIIPYIFYPTLLAALSETRYSLLLKRFLIALPFCLFAGITNVIFDRGIAFIIGGVAVSYGVISLFTILFRAYLCVMTVLLLVATTPLFGITDSMRSLKTPGIFVTIFEMTYRYIGVLFDEAYSMYIAYKLRSAGPKGVDIRDMGSFVGQLLLRSFDRSERVYSAMKCRGYTLRTTPSIKRGYSRGDVVFISIVAVLCIAFRVLNYSELLGGLG